VWILKGSFLGLWIFAFGTLVLLYLEIYRNLGPNTAVAVSVITNYTTRNSLWWAALIISIAVSCLVVRSWPGKGWFWMALMVTFLFPAGLLGLFLAILAKAHHVG
jgi:hypothetical protein